MIYIKETDEDVIKYELEIDKGRLVELREKIIENCSEIEHVEYKGAEEPLIKNDSFRIKNYYKRFTGEITKSGEKTKDIYKIEYEKYNFTGLAIYINMLLNGDLSAYEKLESYKGNTLVKENSTLLNNALVAKEKMEKEMAKNFLDIDIAVSKALLFYIGEIQESFRLNENQQSDMEYYNDVMSCIKLTEIDRLSKEVINRVKEFQGNSYTKKRDK